MAGLATESGFDGVQVGAVDEAVLIHVLAQPIGERFRGGVCCGLRILMGSIGVGGLTN